MAFRINFNVDPKPIELRFKAMQQVPATDHSKLRNRDEADQHPIGAITGLDEALKEAKEAAEEAKEAAEEAKEVAEEAKSAAGEGTGTTDHALLENRDAPDQHPIEAITGLGDAIEDLEESTSALSETTEVLKKSIEEVEPDALSNTEIDDLWKSIM